MPILRAQVVIPRDTALPEDVSVNTWHFLVTSTSPVADTIISEVQTALATFYASIDQLLSPVCNNPVLVKYYDLSLPKPNPPLSTRSMTLTFGTPSAPFPEECAICLSFKGDPAAGANEARRRGRIYLGPLAGGTALQVGGRIRVATTEMTTIRDAAQVLHNTSLAASIWKWGVYSPTAAGAGGTEDGWFTPTAQGWVDDAFDTQRRRGPAATARLTFT